MKSINRLLMFLGFLTLIYGCSSKHGYEGEYKVEKTYIGQVGKAFDSLEEIIGTSGESRIVIGKNHIEHEGIRTDYKKIYAKVSGSSKFLIFVTEEGEESMKIEDNGNKLVQKAGFVSVTFVKINEKN